MTSAGLRLAPTSGEDVTSFLVRNADYLGISVAYLLAEVGFDPRWSGRDLANHDALALANYFGLEANQVADMSLNSLPRNVTGPLVAAAGRVRHPGSGWVLLGPPRSCPDCVAEQGAWLLMWNLGFSFMCLRHQKVLDNGCRACGCPEARLPALQRRRRCTCSPALPADTRAVGSDAALAEVQAQLTGLLEQSFSSAEAVARLTRIRWWLSVFLTVSDPSWPPTDSRAVRLARTIGATDITPHADRWTPRHDSDNARPTASAMATAGWIADALEVAGKSGSDRQALLGEFMRRATWAGQSSRARSRLRGRDADLHPPKGVWRGYRRPSHDLADASQVISEALVNDGLDSRAIPRFLPTRDDPALVHATPTGLGRRWAIGVLAEVEGISLSEACRRWQMPGEALNHVQGHPIGPLTSLAADVAQALLEHRRDFRSLEAEARSWPAVHELQARQLLDRAGTKTKGCASPIVMAALWAHHTHSHPRDWPGAEGARKGGDAITASLLLTEMSAAECDDLIRSLQPAAVA